MLCWVPTVVKNRWFGSFFVCMTVLLATVPIAGAVAFAQTRTATGVIEGTVHDPSGKVVANAAVVVRNTQTDTVAAAATDAAGHFAARGLRPGVYAVEVSAPGFATSRRADVRLTAGGSASLTFSLTVARLNEQVTVKSTPPTAERTAPSQAPLAARSAQSVINSEFIDDFTSPVSDYSQVIAMAPGTFSVSPNGVGLGDTKTYFRGFSDGQYTMTFDGIPFNDTNDPTHHSWAFFPTQFIGGTVFDRSPGSAATIGPSNFGGSVHLLSPQIGQQSVIDGTVSYGSYNTRLFDATYDSGRFGADGKSRLMLDAHQMNSDGYQTFNYQKRDGFAGKYAYALSDRTTLTVFGSYILLNTNTPNTKGPTRAQLAEYGPNYLLSGDPKAPNYYGYNFYRVPTDFEYVGLKSSFGNGWTVDDKAYTYAYYNQENYNSATKISATSAVDKFNGYRKLGNLLPLTQTSKLGILRTGLWSEYSWTNRHQTPSDPLTWVDAAVPNFHETFGTILLQPYAEYEFKVTPKLSVTPGLKLSFYRQAFVQYADNGKKIGNLNGAPSITHTAAYHSWLPSFDVHYMLHPNWSTYAQFAMGDTIPPTSVFDVTGAQVAALPKPTTTKTYEVGTVWNTRRVTLDLDSYYIDFQNDYSSYYDETLGETLYFASGASVSKGFEAEGNVLVGGGLSLYANGTIGRATYADTGLSVASAPKDTETVGLNFSRQQWNIGWFTKRIGEMYNDVGTINQAITINPFALTNLFVNYTLGGSSHFGHTKIRLGINNLFNNQSIVGVKPASSTSLAPSPNDVLTIIPARSVSLTFTVGFSPSPVH
jgi:iron complex outermembrane recepter protein